MTSDTGVITLSTSCKYRKVGNTVEIWLIDGEIDTPIKWITIATLPSGCRPKVYIYSTTYIKPSTNPGGLYIGTNGAIQIISETSGIKVNGHVVFTV